MSNKIIIIHGVQTGDNSSAINGPQKMEKALTGYIDGRAELSVAYPAYESINDETIKSISIINDLILSRLNKAASTVADGLLEIVGDVYNYNYSDVGKSIRDYVRAEIEDNPNCILVGHSLGSVICFDIIADMMRENRFKDLDRANWPIKSLITFGSPLALSMFRNTRNIAPNNGNDIFNWFNYSDRNDPVVSGNIFGSEFEENHLMYDTYKDPNQMYHIHDRQIETGFHLLSHVNYWQNQHIIARIADQLVS